jgi:hypothetical protein
MGSQASATIVTDYVTFSASGFTDTSDHNPPPVDPVTGSFTITFDPSQLYGITGPPATIVTVLSMNIPAGAAPVAPSYTGTGSPPHVLGVGNTAVWPGPFPGIDDFSLVVLDFPDSPIFVMMSYTEAAIPTGEWETDTGTVTVVPLPPTLLLVGTGLMPLAWYRRRNRGGA